MTLLIGAEALKSDAALRNTLIYNPDLTAEFCHVDYRSSNSTGNRQKFSIMAQSYATRWLLTRKMGNGAAARESMRQFSSWLGKREDDFAAQRLDDPFSDYWHIGNDAIGDTILAILRLKGLDAAIQEVLNWRSNEIALNVAIDLSFKLAASNESNLLAECAELSPSS